MTSVRQLIPHTVNRAREEVWKHPFGGQPCPLPKIAAAPTVRLMKAIDEAIEPHGARLGVFVATTGR